MAKENFEFRSSQTQSVVKLSFKISGGNPTLCTKPCRQCLNDEGGHLLTRCDLLHFVFIDSKQLL